MKRSGNSGQIAIFLSIILLSVVLLAGVLIDISRAGAGEAIIKKSAEISAKSILAGYDSRLKEEYGIFAYDITNEDFLNATFRSYLERNLSTADLKSNEEASIYGFKIEKVNVTPVFNMSENEVFRHQLLEYMKFRAPKEMVEGLLDRLSAMKDMGKISRAYSKKVEVDKTLGKMDKVQQKLKRNIDGSGEVGGGFVNGFNLNGSWQNTFTDYISSIHELDTLKMKLQQINGAISLLDYVNIDQSKNDNKNDSTSVIANESKKDIDLELKELQSEREGILKSISELDGVMDFAFDNLKSDLTGRYINSNADAINQVARISELGKNVETAINDLDTYMMENFKDENSYISDFTKIMSSDLAEIKELVLSGQKVTDMTERLQKNIDSLNGISDGLEILDSLVKGGKSSDAISLEDEIMNLLAGYGTIDYSYVKPVKEKEMEDPRKEQSKKLQKTFIGKILNDKDLVNSGIVMGGLPSQKKTTSKDFSSEDEPYLSSRSQNGIEKIDTPRGVEYNGSLGNFAGEADLYDEEAGFQQKALDFAGGIGELLAGDVKKLRDNIYINEYIMGMFKNQVGAIEKNGAEEKSKFLNGIEWENKDTFFDCEVEYILHGNSSEIANRTMTDAQILLLRLGADLIHVYTDPKKKELAITTATAVAGWWTGGAGIPIISNLIMCSWALGEALIDLDDLKEGKQVPLYKRQGDWKLELGLSKAEGLKTDERLNFSYHDYLRLFLLVMDEEKKLGRLEDLIEINIGRGKPGFKAAKANTFIRAEVEVSMNNLFLSKGLIPEKLRSSSGRRIFKVLVYEGY